MTYRSSLLFFLTTKLETLSKSGLDLEEPQEFQALQRTLYQSLDFLNAIEKVAQTHPEWVSENPRSTRESIDLYGMLKAKPLRQGPFLMQPSPIELDSEDEEVASDLIHVRYQSSSGIGQSEADPAASSVGVFMIAYQTRIDVHIEVDKIEPCWHFVLDNIPLNQISRNLPVLITHETIDLQLAPMLDCDEDDSETSKSTHPGLHLIKDSHHPDMIFVWHRCGIQLISMFAWIEPLKTIYQDFSMARYSSQSDIPEAIEGLSGSDVGWLLRTSIDSQTSTAPIHTPAFAVQSVAIVDDPYVGYGIFITIDDGQVILQPLRHRPVLAFPLRSTSPVESVDQDDRSIPHGVKSDLRSDHPLTTHGAPKKHRFYASLLEQAWAPSRILSGKPGSQTLTKIEKPGVMDEVNSKTFKFIGAVTTELDQQILRVIEAVNDAQDRLKLQLMEYRRQLEFVCSAQETLDRLADGSPASEVTQARIARITEFQSKLLQRSDHLLQRLTDQVNPNLSRSESNWFEELRRMKVQVSGGGNVNHPGTGLKFEIEKVNSFLNL